MMENIFNFFDVTMPNISIDEFAEGLGNMAPYVFSHGCTGIHEPGLDSRGVKAFQMARKNGATLPRSYVMVMGDAFESAVNLGVISGFGDPFLTIGSAKFWIDGSLGSRSAALLEPYSDDLENFGTILLSGYEDEYSKAHRNLMQTSTHAIGDRAVIEVLDTLESVLGEYPRKDHRHRIEHCELLGSEQIQRIKDLGVVAAMQPNFVGAWCILQPMYQQRLGKDRMRWCNPYRQLLDAGVVVAFGSDGLPFGPMFGVWGAVNHPVRARTGVLGLVTLFALNAPSYWVSFVLAIIASISAGIVVTVSSSFSLEQIPEYQGTMMSLYSAADSLGTTVSATVGGYLLLVYGYGSSSLVMGVMGLLSALAFQYLTTNAREV